MGNVDRIVLVGFSGTGKTSIARRLAERLGWSAADTDMEIERHWGATIPAIFRNYGESTFRSSERAILKQLVTQDLVVIATGGGAAVDSEVWDQEMLGSEGTLVIALDASPETMLARLQRQAADEGRQLSDHCWPVPIRSRASGISSRSGKLSTTERT